MAKFKLETLPEGVIIVRILEELAATEAQQIMKGIEKVLANGKARIILEFAPPSLKGPAGPDFFEKTLRPLKTLAKKMRGDLLYVVPDPEGQKVFGAISTLKTAMKTILGQLDLGKERTELVAELEKIKVEHEKLTAENTFLSQKIEELAKTVSLPSTDAELKAAVKHYQALAAEVEAAPPAAAPGGKPEKQK